MTREKNRIFVFDSWKEFQQGSNAIHFLPQEVETGVLKVPTTQRHWQEIASIWYFPGNFIDYVDIDAPHDGWKWHLIRGCFRVKYIIYAWPNVRISNREYRTQLTTSVVHTMLTSRHPHSSSKQTFWPYAFDFRSLVCQITRSGHLRRDQPYHILWSHQLERSAPTAMLARWKLTEKQPGYCGTENNWRIQYSFIHMM